MTLTNKQISKKYNRFSLFYDFIERPIEKKLFSKWRKELLKEVKGRVLEIGVGTGKNFPYYNHEKVDLTAIDISKGMLNKAKKKANDLGLKVKLELTNTDYLPFKDDSFDYVIATFVLCSVPDQKKMLLEIKRVVKNSGNIFLLDHVLSKNKLIAFFQNIHNPFTKFLLGVNVNRDTIGSIKKTGLKIVKEKNLALKDVFKETKVKK
ncbi:class I SAM-dependent methyltransferase [Candidatus Woesearchaeota archaeon]|jgi:ubiquinone/menaquinone biosynthesis C-methylase UbiE|nr:class I SAM-dependent methyltransferase [Candidatus Woesearchaeota archaeon]MBT5740241.1 class I SAM-dependent methyltransferase [Candidatus Woesearchaeota archaeon]